VGEHRTGTGGLVLKATLPVPLYAPRCSFRIGGVVAPPVPLPVFFSPFAPCRMTSVDTRGGEGSIRRAIESLVRWALPEVRRVAHVESLHLILRRQHAQVAASGGPRAFEAWQARLLDRGWRDDLDRMTIAEARRWSRWLEREGQG
jgi:hypothetical protein